MDLSKQTQKKYKNLELYIESLGSLAVAFSGGVDSTFLAKVAHDTLGDKMIAVTERSEFFPKREDDEAASFCRNEGINQIIIKSQVLKNENIKKNPQNRCYYCKSQLFTQIKSTAKKYGIEHIAEGSNMDDNGDYRPGLQAVAELGILSPLRHAGLYKSEIREISKYLELPTWNKPSMACLASRVPYGQSITADDLKKIEQGEDFLRSSGFNQLRVRINGSDTARIEIPVSDFESILNSDTRNNITREFKKIGFKYICLDLQGFRSGSMNEVL